MRRFTRKEIDEMDLSGIEFDLKSRDDIPQLLRGLQYIFLTPSLREEVFQILDTLFPEKLDRNNGRPGMDMWSIFVMGVLRLNLNWDYDRLHEMVNNHRTIRQILGHAIPDDGDHYGLQNLKDNVALLTPEILDKINQVVVKAGHIIVKKIEDDDSPKADESAESDKLRGRCDSFVVETDVDYPTDTKLLFDALRKVIELLMRLCKTGGLSDWQDGRNEIKRLKKLLRHIQRLKRSSSKKEEKKEARDKEIIKAHEKYLEVARQLLQRVDKTLRTLREKYPNNKKLLKIEEFIGHAERQIDHIERRVIHGEKIPHEEKVFSIFEPYTEWLSKGKAGVAVELGLNVCILEDQYHFILHHQVMQKQTDEQVAVPMVKETQTRFPNLTVCSFDQGFHSPDNQTELADLLELAVLPRKGRLSIEEQTRQNAEDFVQARCQHAAVESAINALEVHGLDRCPDHGLPAFKRYVALAVVARNIQLLGRYLGQQEKEAGSTLCQQAA